MVALAVPKQYDPQAVLLADDEREHVRFLVNYLERKGFKVSFVTSAAEAFAAAKETHFRAYFIDLNIPRGSWVEPEESNQM